MTPFTAKLIRIDGEECNETVVVLEWSSFGESFLVPRSDGTLEVLRADSVKLKVNSTIIPSLDKEAASNPMMKVSLEVPAGERKKASTPHAEQTTVIDRTQSERKLSK